MEMRVYKWHDIVGELFTKDFKIMPTYKGTNGFLNKVIAICCCEFVVLPAFIVCTGQRQPGTKTVQNHKNHKSAEEEVCFFRG